MALRKYGIRLLVLSAILGSACRPAGEARLGPDARRQLDDGQRSATEWVALARTRVEVDARTAIAAGYLERLRLGLGSPFRLVESALADPRLDDSTRTRLSWALLARTLSRESFRVDPGVLDLVGLGSSTARMGSGRFHLDLIDGAIRQATDPRAGDLAVRIAYSLAAAEGAVTGAAPDLAARTASLIRDRELARADVLRLLGEARDRGVDPLRMLVQWRADREFEVERPPTTPLPPQSELHAMETAPRLARVVADLGSRSASAGIAEGQRGASFGRAAALRLIEAADSLRMPPVAPIAVSARMHRDILVDRPWVDAAERDVRIRFIADASNEERFVAGLALLQRNDPLDTGPAIVALAAAVAMRSLAQEPVWYPGFGGPPARELQERYGLASFTFGDDVEPGWRPYYRYLLDNGLRDLARVLPSLRLDGLAVVVTDEGRQESTLALHDPRARRLVLPPATAAGTLAHEVAHDLDWQVALRRYRVRGDYATDRATRLGRDRLAQRVQDLAGAGLEPNDDRSAHSRRPAEVFARNVDWFVVVSLAAQGRSNGYLSSVQDEFLTGHGTVRPPDISGVAGQALIAILDEVAPVYADTRQLFEKRYGAARALTPWDLTRRVLGTSPASRGGTEPDELDALTSINRAFRAIEADRDAALAAIDAWVCTAPGSSFNREFETARRMLVAEAARARAHGLALRLARELGGRDAWTWMGQRLHNEPATFGGPTDSTLIAVLAPIVEASGRASAVHAADVAPRIDLTAPPARCAAAPLRIGRG